MVGAEPVAVAGRFKQTRLQQTSWRSSSFGPLLPWLKCALLLLAR